MTVSTAPTPLSYDGNGSTTDFSITWKYNAKSHVVATLRSTTGTETTWSLTTNYTLTDPGDTGTLTAVVAPATGETLVITLEPPNTQSSALPLGGDFPSETVEDGLDLAAQRDGKIEALFLRALRVPRSDERTGSMLELPIETDRASKFLAFDSAGDPIASAGSADTVAVSSFMSTVLDDTTAADARTTLGAQASDAELTAIAGLTSAADKVPYFTGSGTAALADLTSFGRSLIDDANAAAARTTIGLTAATSAEIKTGTEAAKYVAPDALLAAIGFSAEFVSTAQTITSGGPLTIAHGLARTPYDLYAVVTCTTNQSPFVVGNEVPVTININQPTTRGVSVWSDATNLNVRFGSEATNCISSVSPADGSQYVYTNTSWSIRFVARA